MAHWNTYDADPDGLVIPAGPYWSGRDVPEGDPSSETVWLPVLPADFSDGNLTPEYDPGTIVNSLTHSGAGVYQLDITGSGLDRDSPDVGALFKLLWPRKWSRQGSTGLGWRVIPQTNPTALGPIIGIMVSDNNGNSLDAATTMVGAGAYAFAANAWRPATWNRLSFGSIAGSFPIADGPEFYGSITPMGKAGNASNVGVQLANRIEGRYFGYRRAVDAFTTSATQVESPVSGPFIPMLFIGFDGTGVGNQVIDFKLEWCITGGFQRGTFSL